MSSRRWSSRTEYNSENALIARMTSDQRYRPSLTNPALAVGSQGYATSALNQYTTDRRFLSCERGPGDRGMQHIGGIGSTPHTGFWTGRDRGGGTVVERFAYTPYGVANFSTGSTGPAAGSVDGAVLRPRPGHGTTLPSEGRDSGCPRVARSSPPAMSSLLCGQSPQSDPIYGWGGLGACLVGSTIMLTLCWIATLALPQERADTRRVAV